MSYLFDARSAPKSSAATKITFAMFDTSTGAFSATLEAQLIGTGLAYNATTGALTGTVTQVVIADGATVMQTHTLQSANSTTSATDVTAWMADAKSTLNSTTPFLTMTNTGFASSLSNFATDTVTGATSARLAIMNGASTVGFVEFVGTGIEKFGSPAAANVSFINVLDSAGNPFVPARTVDISSDPINFDRVAYGFGFDLSGLGMHLLRGNDTVVVAAANTKVVDAGLGDDAITGNGTSDTVAYTSAIDAVSVNLSSGVVTGGGGNDALTTIENVIGSLYAGDTIVGSNGANILDGGYDNSTTTTLNKVDVLQGGLGDDTYVLRDGVDSIVEASGGGNDLLISTIDRDLTKFTGAIERLEILGTAINAKGNTLANTITGNASANVIDGWTGADTLVGLAGNDTYKVDNAGDVITEAAGNGTDVVKTTVTYALNAGASVEVLETTDASLAGAINLTGNELAQTINGNAGNNKLDGGADALTDTLVGGAGNDTYELGSGTDTVTESSLTTGGTDDLIKSSVTRSLASYTGVEHLTLTGSSAADATGNAGNNKLIGNDGNNTINGAGGNDTITSGLGTDIVVWDGLGADTFTDMALANDDVSVAGLGIGDFATVQALASASGTSTILRKTLNGVTSSLTLTGITKASLTSSHFVLSSVATNDTLNGGAVVDYLFGAGGDDTINGLAGNDWLFGEAGNDTIDGGAGSDRLYGGLGNDTYKIDSLSDFIIENAGEGTDTIQTALNLSLNIAANLNVENLATTNAAGTGAMSLTGNSLVNSITGNAGANIINGLGGGDTMTGLGGNDSYYVDNAGDTVVEGAAEGTADRIYTSLAYTLSNTVFVEYLQTSVNGTNTINLTGNSSANTIIGSNAISTTSGVVGGNNTINGMLGNDVLTGGSGNDTFVFNTALNATTNKDTITDFIALNDTIALENGVMTALGSTLGTLATGKFYVGTAAHDLDDRIIYNKATGELSYDADGSLGGVTGVVFAVLSTKPTITNADFTVI